MASFGLHNLTFDTYKYFPICRTKFKFIFIFIFSTKHGNIKADQAIFPHGTSRAPGLLAPIEY